MSSSRTRTKLPPIDPALVAAWLTARSVARGLPAPVADRGGWRVNTDSETETCRWVFAQPCDGIAQVAASVLAPRQFIKLCGDAETLRAALPSGWQVRASGWFMASGPASAAPTLPSGYTLLIDPNGPAATAQIRAPDGSIAASGHCAETADAFVYDRIETAEAHRRRGLGRAIMAALRTQRRSAPELLVATEAGRQLYETIGWRVLSPYSTAALPG